MLYHIHNPDVQHRHRTIPEHLDSEEVDDFVRNGFLRLRVPLEREYNSMLKIAIHQQLEKQYGNTPISTYTSGKFAGQYLRQPHEESVLFIDVLSDAYPYADMVRSLIGPRISIRAYSVRVTHPFSEQGTAWHSDQRSLVTPRPILFTEPRVMTLGIYLDGASDANGAFHVLPGSHRWERQPEDHELYSSFPEQVTLRFEPGEAVLFDAAIWHRGGKNNSEKQRRMIIIHLAPVFCKPALYSTAKSSQEYDEYVARLRQEGNEAMLELLGFNGLKNYPGFM